MKRFVSLLLCAIILLTCCVFPAGAENEEMLVPHVVDFSLTSPVYESADEAGESRATGLILMYGIEITVVGSSIKIYGRTYCDDSVVKSGFKNLVVERRRSSSNSWSEYYDYGNLYTDSYFANVSTTLAVESGYQYRVSCKHYAKKSLLVTQSVSNTSNIVSV